MKKRDLDRCNYEKMTDREACFNINGVKSCGVILHNVSMIEILGSKNGVELKQVTVIDKIHYDLYMDGEFLNRFYNLKTAKAMFKDFSA